MSVGGFQHFNDILSIYFGDKVVFLELKYIVAWILSYMVADMSSLLYIKFPSHLKA